MKSRSRTSLTGKSLKTNKFFKLQSEIDYSPLDISSLDKYLIELRSRRDDYSDDIPDMLLHSTMCLDSNGIVSMEDTEDKESVTPFYKCRQHFIQGFLALIELGVNYGYLDEKYNERWEDFWQYIEDTDLRNRLTEKEDIDKANKLLNDAISDLEKKLT